MPEAPPSARLPETGFWLSGVLSLVLVGACLAAYLQGGGSLEAVRLIGRWTIRVAVVLFSLAFMAAALASLLPGRTTKWLLENHRNIMVAFSVAFALHLCAIARFFSLDQGLFWSVSPVFLIVLRGIGVAFIVLTLFASLGGGRRERWTWLTALGYYYVCGAFLAGFAKRIPQDHFYIAPVALLSLALVVNLLSVVKQRNMRVSQRSIGSSDHE